MKKVLCSVLATVFLATVLLGSMPFSVAASSGGMTFSSSYTYETAEPLGDLPATFEATLMLPKGLSGRGGVIYGNYPGFGRCVSFEIHHNGNPRLFIDDNGVKDNYSCIFNNVDLRTGDWVHVAIVKDSDNNNVHCYVDGELKQTKSFETPKTADINCRMVLGGDLRSGNVQNFKGTLKNVAVYKDIRTAAEVKSDAKSTKPDKSALTAYYDLSSLSSNKPETIKDQSSDKRDLTLTVPGKRWFTQKDAVTDYAYSFAFVGDTQKVAINDPDKFHYIYDWLVENAEEKNLKFVFGLGDITDKNTAAEWAVAKENIKKLDSVVPYSLVRGNHDGKQNYMDYMSYDEYTNQLGGMYEDNILNCWQTLEVGTIKYLIMCLDYGPSDAVMNWASGVIKDHPDHNVIITTHCYLFRDGTTLDENDVAPPTKAGGGFNNGDHIWDKLVKKHKNIVLVVSGHDPYDNIVVKQAKGNEGNLVTQILIDPQGVDLSDGSTGLVAMFHFSEDGKNIQVEYYSTIKKQFFKEENQISFEIACLGGTAGTSANVGDTSSKADDAASDNASSDDTSVKSDATLSETDESEKGGSNITVIIIAVAAAVIGAAGATAGILIVQKKKKPSSDKSE